MRELSGQQLGAYELRGVIGRGAVAAVYEAYQPSLNRVVAVKVLSQQDDAEVMERFRREVRSIAALNHPNILPVFDHGEAEDAFFVVVKYVEGGRTVADLIGQPLAPARAIELIDKLLAGLDHAHRKGLVHRDVKPTNVLLAEPEWPLLADFGIAKVLRADTHQLTAPGMVVGTPAYMSPEQCLGHDVDGRTDLYAAGILLYELLTGRTPFEADTAEAMLVQQAYTPPPAPSEFNARISPEVEALLLTALAKDPAKRFSDAAAMRGALRALPAAEDQPALAWAPLDGARLDGATAEIPARAAAGGPADTIAMRPTPPDPPDPPDLQRRQRGTRRRRRGPLPAVLLLVVMLTAGVSGFLVVRRHTDAVLLEPLAATGPAPFTKSIAASAPTTIVPKTVAAPKSSGAEPGLFGGTPDQRSCDVAQLRRFLQANPQKAGAWAEALSGDPTLRWSGGNRIAVEQIPAYLAELTPVLLRQDTRVTNHGYRSGRPVPRQAVLQTGTAVLIDAFGAPRIRCACGNPLAPPLTGDAEPAFKGDAWSGFESAAVVAITAAAEPIPVLVVAVPGTGELDLLPTGSQVGQATGADARPDVGHGPASDPDREAAAAEASRREAAEAERAHRDRPDGEKRRRRRAGVRPEPPPASPPAPRPEAPAGAAPSEPPFQPQTSTAFPG